MAFNNEGDPWIAKREDTVAGHQYIWFSEVRPGLGRIVALFCRPSTLYHIH
jgi:hypothetical protein